MDDRRTLGSESGLRSSPRNSFCTRDATWFWLVQGGSCCAAILLVSFQARGLVRSRGLGRGPEALAVSSFRIGIPGFGLSSVGPAWLACQKARGRQNSRKVNSG